MKTKVRLLRPSKENPEIFLQIVLTLIRIYKVCLTKYSTVVGDGHEIDGEGPDDPDGDADQHQEADDGGLLNTCLAVKRLYGKSSDKGDQDEDVAAGHDDVLAGVLAGGHQQHPHHHNNNLDQNTQHHEEHLVEGRKEDIGVDGYDDHLLDHDGGVHDYVGHAGPYLDYQTNSITLLD